MIGLYLLIPLNDQVAPEVEFLFEAKLGFETFLNVVVLADRFLYLERCSHAFDVENDRRRFEQSTLDLTQKSFDDPELNGGLTGALYKVRQLLNLFKWDTGFGSDCHIIA